MISLRRQGRTVRLGHQGRDSCKGVRGSSAKRDDVDVAWIMKRTGNDVTIIRDKGRGVGHLHPEKIALRRHADPTRQLSVVGEGKQAQCIEALDRLNIPLHATRDDAAYRLRAQGYFFSNETIAAALKYRRSSASDRTATDEDRVKAQSTYSSLVRPRTPP